MLQISSSTPQPQLTASLRRAKLYARSKGDRESAMVAAAYAAQKTGKTYWVYQGNSYGHSVWLSEYRRSNALNAINNTGGYLYEVTPDLDVTRHEIAREEFSQNSGTDTSHLDALELRLSSAGGGSRLEPNVRKGHLSRDEWLMARKAWREAAEAQALEWAAEAFPGDHWDAVTSRVFNRRLDKLDNFLRFFFRAEYELNPVLFDSYDGAALVILPRAAGLRLARRLFGGGPGISGDLQEEDLSWNMDWFRPRSFH